MYEYITQIIDFKNQPKLEGYNLFFSLLHKFLASSAITIGLLQAVAILPGISRSGATIATAVLLGIDKEKAARFSFLMVIPLIFGSMAKSLMDADNINLEDSFFPMFIGFVGAFITGIIACKWMIAIVKKAQLTYFSYYCFIVGLSAIVLHLL